MAMVAVIDVAIQGASLPILDAIAATLRGNPDIAKVEIGGHASADESEVWGLSSRRAAIGSRLPLTETDSMGPNTTDG